MYLGNLLLRTATPPHRPCGYFNGNNIIYFVGKLAGVLNCTLSHERIGDRDGFIMRSLDFIGVFDD